MSLPNASAAVATGVAPAAPYASSPNDAASPAPRSTTTDRPALTSRPATIAVMEVARSDDDDVVEVPDPHPTQGEAHPDAALNAPGVEAVQPERAAQDRQPERHAARALGHRGLPRARLRLLVPRQRPGGHVAGPESPARASSRCRGITPVCRPTS